MADGRVQHNVAATVRRPTGGRVRREGQALTLAELHALTAARASPYRDVVPVLALAGLRWGELAGLQVGERISVPGAGLRLRRAVLASEGGGALYVDTLKNHRARTVPLVAELVPIIDRWSAGKEPEAWLFAAPGGGPLRESNWKRSVGWRAAKVAAGVPDVRVHDLRHTAASLWLAAGADPKVVQRVLGHATAAMTMDLYGHLVDASVWQAARLVGGTTGASERPQARIRTEPEPGRDAKTVKSWAFTWEPPWGIEPQTYALREARHPAPGPLPAPIAACLPRNAHGAQGARGCRSMTRSTAGPGSW
jgi:site-specific recombinase XerD